MATRILLFVTTSTPVFEDKGSTSVVILCFFSFHKICHKSPNIAFIISGFSANHVNIIQRYHLFTRTSSGPGLTMSHPEEGTLSRNPLNIPNVEFKSVQLIRLFRYSDKLGLSRESKTLLTDCLFKELESIELGQDFSQSEKTSKIEPVLLRIRQLVQSEAKWSQIETFAWKLYSLRPTPEVGARILELSFLHGKLKDVEHVIAKLKKFREDFYSHIHPAVKTHLIVRLWNEGLTKSLSKILFAEKNALFLQPIERLLIFWSSVDSKNPEVPYNYFKRYHRELIAATCELGHHVGKPSTTFFLAVGHLASELGYEAEAEKLYQDGVKSYSGVQSMGESVSSVQLSDYERLLEEEKTAAGRIKLLSEFCSVTRGFGGFNDRSRPVLNRILKNSDRVLPQTSESWSLLSQLLVENRDLEGLLPNIYAFFQKNALVFHHPSIEQAVWETLITLQEPGDVLEDARDLYWRGVALLHKYACYGVADEATLWEAKSRIAAAKKTWNRPLPFEWSTLHQAILAEISKNKRLPEARKASMHRQLRVSGDRELLTVRHIEEYLSESETPPLIVLRELRDYAKAEGNDKLEMTLIMKLASLTHLRNADLNRIWSLACASSDYDLAWRTATVLTTRQAIAEPVFHAWNISGEKRSDYPLITPPEEVMECCIWGFSPALTKFLRSLVIIGPHLPGLLDNLDRDAQMIQVPKPAKGSVEERIDGFLGQIDWLYAPKKGFFSKSETKYVLDVKFRGFSEPVAENPWSYLAFKTTDKLGINAWGWRLSYLQNLLDCLIPRNAGKSSVTKRTSLKVAFWLKSLSKRQKEAWHDLISASRKVTDDDAFYAMASFIARVATVMLQSHYQALMTMQTLNTPISVVWNLESWILSKEYSSIRASMGTGTKIPIPAVLRETRF